MNSYDPARCAGQALRHLIEKYYSSQEEFSYDFGMDLRTVSRYVNQGINKVGVIQELAEFFHVSFLDFFSTDPSAF